MVFTAGTNLARFRNKLSSISKGIAGALLGSSGFSADVAMKHALQRFEESGSNKRAQVSPSGKKWPPPSPNTLRTRKKNKSGASQALVDTGLMRNSLQATQSRSGGDHQIDISIKPGVFYKRKRGRISVAEVAALQQKGFITHLGGVVPARPFSGIDDDTARIIEGNVFTRLKAQLRGLD